mmetsp:Transcript_996/g.2839  ORF Transcript_996/g.2839 Transcript_996/m.2839 type:complete len:214 (+) Transcript_996:479-1120(+)
MASESGKSRSECHVSAAVGNQFPCLVCKGVHTVLMHVIELLHSVARCCFDHIDRLRRTDALQLDSLLVFQKSQHLLLVVTVERHARALSATAGRSSRPVDVLVQIRGRMRLHHQIHGGHVQTTSGHVRGHQAANSAVPETLHDGLTHSLRDVPVQDAGSNGPQLFVGRQFITLLLGVSEDQSPPETSSMNLAEVTDAVTAHLGRTRHALVFDQ